MSDEVFFTSDTHFWHKGILRHMPRPWEDVQEMNEGLIARWNAKVTKSDRVYHLGDVSFGSLAATQSIVERLNGFIHVVYGNHDRNIQRVEASNLVWVKPYKEVTVHGQKIVLFHYPITVWNDAHHESWHLHGHTHGNLAESSRNGPMLDVGVDSHDYAPVSFDEVSTLLAGRQYVPVDHHSRKISDGT